ncbi:MAG: hypothetical protein HQK66_06405, partial [Desulfamplus sp.]|nr:hypothetical protein [Desulfamplus sp.]
EFPTGNGKVDIHLKCQGKKGLIEVKSFSDLHQLRKGVGQAAGYARETDMPSVTIALFTPFDDADTLEKLSIQETVDGIHVMVKAIAWPAVVTQ